MLAPLWVVSILLPSALSAPELYTPPGGKVGCSSMVEQFCDRLWSPQNLGNMDVKVGSQRREIRQGRRPNEFGYELWNYLQARLQSRSRLPIEFRAKLEAKAFFQKLQTRLAKKPNKQLGRTEFDKTQQLAVEIEVLWDRALEEVVFEKMEKHTAGFYQLTNDNIPHRTWLIYTEYRDRLESEISRAIWETNSAWKEAVARFETVRSEYIQTIESHPVLSPETKKDWSDRLRAVKLVIPGSDPKQLDSLHRNCSRTASNAFYLPTENTITVCGGYLQGVELTRTIAHELSHALSIRRTVYRHKAHQPIAALLDALNSHACAKPLACDAWQDWKKGFSAAVSKLEPVQMPNSAFLACFRKRELKDTAPDKELLAYLTKSRTADTIEYLASRSMFLQMTKEKEVLRDGTQHPNPRYLNPCGFSWSNSTWERLVNPMTLSAFFVHEYHCSAEAAPTARLEAAIEGAKQMGIQLMERELLAAGPFTSDRELERQGYAEDIEEDFADYLSGEVFVNLLRKLPDLVAKRSLVLASLAQLCDEPSLEKLYADEAATQKKFYFESHSEGVERRQRLLIAPIRKELECTRDFKPTIKECDWDGKAINPAPL